MPTDLTPEELAELERFADEHATAAPWSWGQATPYPTLYDAVFGPEGGSALAYVNEAPNAEAIVAMRNALPALLAAYRERDQLRAENERLTLRRLTLEQVLNQVRIYKLPFEARTLIADALAKRGERG